jgi:hypothetical protein
MRFGVVARLLFLEEALNLACAQKTRAQLGQRGQDHPVRVRSDGRCCPVRSGIGPIAGAIFFKKLAGFPSFDRYLCRRSLESRDLDASFSIAKEAVMPNSRPRWWLRYVAAMVILLILWLGTRAQNWTRPESGAPTSLEQVAEIAERDGLFQSGDAFDGKIGTRLIVSTTLVTPERAACTPLRELKHPSWDGTVAIYQRLRGMYVDPNPPHAVIWGNFYVCGDPEVIRRLTSATP